MPAHRRRSPWYVLPVALATVTIASFAIAVQAERADSKPKPLAASAATTPVLSARRVPSVLAAPVADERLQAQLQQLVDSSPGAMCVEVHIDGRDLFQSGDTAPLVPASLEKLLTGTIALEVLGADTTMS